MYDDIYPEKEYAEGDHSGNPRVYKYQDLINEIIADPHNKAVYLDLIDPKDKAMVIKVLNEQLKKRKKKSILKKDIREQLKKNKKRIADGEWIKK
jgi:hypothetical protein